MPDASSTAMTSLITDIGVVANTLGLFLALASLFTSEQSRRVHDERRRTGNPDRSQLTRILAMTCGLLLVTSAALVTMFRLFLKCLPHFWSEPVCGVFAFVWSLLVGLVLWQVAIFLGALRLRRQAG